MRVNGQTVASLYAFNTAFIRVCQPSPSERYQATTSESSRNAICSLRSCSAFFGRPRLARSSRTPVCAVAPFQKDRTAVLSRTLYGTSAWGGTLGSMLLFHGALPLYMKLIVARPHGRSTLIRRCGLLFFPGLRAAARRMLGARPRASTLAHQKTASQSAKSIACLRRLRFRFAGS